MLGRGGRREGAGRKRVLDPIQAILIGIECEKRWERLARKQALQKNQNRPDIQQVRVHQARLGTIPVKLRRRSSVAETLAEVGEDIGSLLPKGRFRAIPIKRPYGARARIIADVIEWYLKRTGRRLTARRVDECWDRHRTVSSQCD
jgi:hypothetical protein